MSFVCLSFFSQSISENVCWCSCLLAKMEGLFVMFDDNEQKLGELKREVNNMCVCVAKSLLLISFFAKYILCAQLVLEQHVLLSAKSCMDRLSAVSCTDKGWDCCYSARRSCYLCWSRAGVFHLPCCLWSRTVWDNIRCTDKLHCSSQPHAGLTKIMANCDHFELFEHIPGGS